MILMSLISKIKNGYNKILKDHHQDVPITCIDDFEKTPVSYEQRILNENWTFDEKPRDAETGNEIAINNKYVIKYLILERKLSSFNGNDLWKYVEEFVNSRKFTKILSIGSGPCAVEMEIANNLKSDYQWDCIDLNENLIKDATRRAREKGFNLNPIVGDINTTSFNSEYDLVIAIASLHHFVKLVELFSTINKALKAEGEFVTYEPICRSGMFLFRMQRIILGFIFLLLPAKYRINHQDYPGEKRVDRFYNEYDRSGWTFECIRSGDIASLLKKHFVVKHYGRGMTFLRRVSDSLYGPNYNLDDKRDKRVANLLCYTDRFCRFFHLLPIEGLFFIGKKLKDK